MKKKRVRKLVVLGLTGIMALGVGCSKKEKTVNISSMSSDELADYLESLPKDEQERIKKSLDNKDKDDKTDKEDNNEKDTNKTGVTYSNEKSNNNKYKYTCDLCGKSIPYSYIEGDAMMCKSCAAKQECYLTDKDCNGRVGNSYECKTCGRYFSSKKARNMCTHGRCKGCGTESGTWKGDVTWVEGEGFYCERCGVRMAEKEEAENNKECYMCGRTDNLTKVPSGHYWAYLCPDCLQELREEEGLE